MKRDWSAAVLAFCFVALQALDVATTAAGLRLGAAEGHPLGAAMIGAGWPAAVAAKVLATGFVLSCVVVLLRSSSPVNRVLGWVALCGACAAVLVVVLLNVRVLLLVSS